MRRTLTQSTAGQVLPARTIAATLKTVMVGLVPTYCADGSDGEF
jgi:hypothetical protein